MASIWNRICEESYSEEFSAGFWQALRVWINKPHVLCKRLCGSEIENDFDFTEYNLQSLPTLDQINLLRNEVLNNGFTHKSIINSLILTKNQSSKLSENEIMDNFDKEGDGSGINCDENDENRPKLEVLIRYLLPKNTQLFAEIQELIILDQENSLACFIPVLNDNSKLNPDLNKEIDISSLRVQISPDLPYAFKVHSVDTNSSISMFVCGEHSKMTKSVGCTEDWLKNELFQRILRWSKNPTLNTAATTLQLLDVERYNEVYQEVKKKYASFLLEKWSSYASTNAEKFIFEDIALATYLLVLWEQEREDLSSTEKQTFVDLGCGNGLLVYILSCEGHDGIGIDLRRRTTWDMYDSNVNLQERPIIPSDSSLFPEFDWIIGNHSDELTPWIPVMSARSSYKSRFLVLPCCTYDFDAKYKRTKTNISTYRSYLNYVTEIGLMCGFHISEDILRIPSTKKICLIGMKRSYDHSVEDLVEGERKAFIHRHITNLNVEPQITKLSHNRCYEVADPDKCDKSDPQWSSEFKVRDESVFNKRLKISQDLKAVIIHTVFSKLLNRTDAVYIDLKNGSQWNGGGVLHLNEIISFFDPVELMQLKSECGGIQTVLKTHHHIFKVVKGYVSIRNWTKTDNVQDIANRMKKSKKWKRNKNKDKTDLLKTRMCWFLQNHPNGCPQTSSDCNFAHTSDELSNTEK